MVDGDDTDYDWQGCTGVAACWCPVHGDCACRCNEHDCPVEQCTDCWYHDMDIDARSCPLHSVASTHAIPPEQAPEVVLDDALKRAKAVLADLEARKAAFQRKETK